MANRRGKKSEDTAELLNLLTRRETLMTAHDEYEEIDKALKARIRGRTRILVGDWLITGKWIERAAYQVEGGRQWLARIAKKA